MDATYRRCRGAVELIATVLKAVVSINYLLEEFLKISFEDWPCIDSRPSTAYLLILQLSDPRIHQRYNIPQISQLARCRISISMIAIVSLRVLQGYQGFQPMHADPVGRCSPNRRLPQDDDNRRSLCSSNTNDQYEMRVFMVPLVLQTTGTVQVDFPTNKGLCLRQHEC